MKKFLSLVLAVLMTTSLLAGCGSGGNGSASSSASGSSSAKAVQLNMNVTTSESSVWMVAATEFKQKVEDQTDGRYIINIYPNEQLSSGDMVKGVEMLFSGVTDVDLHSLINMTGFEQKLTVCCMPWLFPNGYDSVDQILFNGDGEDYLFGLIRAKGAEPLALGENGFRQITNNVRPIQTPADLKNLKIRVPAIQMYTDLYKLLGADPTAMSFSEVFTALQQGTIDGEENPYDTIRSGKINEVQKYMSVWNYSYDPIVLSVSSKVWESLSDADKQIFKTAATEACTDEVTQSRQKDSEIVDEFKKEGMQITDLSSDQISAFQKAVAPIYDSYKDVVGEDALQAFGYTAQ